MAVILLCLAQFVIVLDVTIVAIALPLIRSDLGLSTAALGWVVSSYTLTFGGPLLAAGRLADQRGRRRMFVAGMALFGLASLACGLAASGAMLLAARACQGLGAALVAPAALSLLTTVRPAGRGRARAVGWWTAAAAAGGAGGWVLGGVLSGVWGWRSIFFVNVPLCLAAVVLARRLLPERRDPRPGRPDLAGAALATGGLAALTLALTLAGSHGPLAATTLAAAGAAAALLLGFVAVEARVADPVLDWEALRRPGMPRANVVVAVLTATTTPPMLLCTLHAQEVLGLDPAAAGLLFPPFNLAVVAGSLAGPRVVAAAGTPAAMTGGLAGVAAGALALYAIAPDAPALASMVAGFVLMGAGLGVASVAATAAGTAAVDDPRQGFASGMLSTSAQLGTVLGLAVVVPVATAWADTRGGGPSAQVGGFELGFTLAALTAGLTALAVSRSSSSRRVSHM